MLYKRNWHIQVSRLISFMHSFKNETYSQDPFAQEEPDVWKRILNEICNNVSFYTHEY